MPKDSSISATETHSAESLKSEKGRLARIAARLIARSWLNSNIARLSPHTDHDLPKPHSTASTGSSEPH